MKKYDCVFLDRDGTINPDTGYIKNLNNFKFFNFLFPALKKMSKVCDRFCIISNQSGVGRGIIDEKDIYNINKYISKKFKINNIKLLDIYVCFDHPDNASNRRKPGTGMFLEAKNDHCISLSKSLMIGDSFCDIKAGESLGMDTMLVLTGNGQKSRIDILDQVVPTYEAKNLIDGAKILCH